ncbi:MAG: acyltransferase [Tannerella sp.]|jgi:peptidoglycan/LPS O-acetylase OafA/YrhL|nr:acyltransferase [Tannerella sp.]
MDKIASKPHYEILDGLRGVASLVVIWFHLFEAHTFGDHIAQVVNHGYLAVDFFFLLSGYVIGYAYDDRWGKISIGDFFRRRLIRLHPMIIVGMIVGAVLFYFADSPAFPGIHNVPLYKMLIVMVIGMTLIPIPLSMDVRGWDEMHPLDGPAWSLFFEYIANILYALFIRRFSKLALSILVALAACALMHYAVTNPAGDIIGGWSLTPEQLKVGFTRLMYPFFAGLLLSRITKPSKVPHAFLLCSLLVVVALAMPRVGGTTNLTANGIYDACCIIFLFPVIVWLGASGNVKGKMSSRVCKFLGDISYPLYITHYPIVYIYTGWVSKEQIALIPALPVALIAFVSCITLAYLCLRFYDLPVRAWLQKKWQRK